MDITNPKHAIGFVLVAGAFFYLAGVLWSSFYIVTIPQEGGWCRLGFEFETGPSSSEWVCVEFKNKVEELKYHHNIKMRDRNEYWVYDTIGAGVLLAVFIFHVIPTWPGRQNSNIEPTATIGGAISLGVVVSILMPLLLNWVVAPRDKWFPKEFVRIVQLSEQEVLERLKKSAFSKRVTKIEKNLEQLKNKPVTLQGGIPKDFSLVKGGDIIERILKEIKQMKPSSSD